MLWYILSCVFFSGKGIFLRFSYYKKELVSVAAQINNLSEHCNRVIPAVTGRSRHDPSKEYFGEVLCWDAITAELFNFFPGGKTEEQIIRDQRVTTREIRNEVNKEASVLQVQILQQLQELQLKDTPPKKKKKKKHGKRDRDRTSESHFSEWYVAPTRRSFKGDTEGERSSGNIRIGCQSAVGEDVKLGSRNTHGHSSTASTAGEDTFYPEVNILFKINITMYLILVTSFPAYFQTYLLYSVQGR